MAKLMPSAPTNFPQRLVRFSSSTFMTQPLYVVDFASSKVYGTCDSEYVSRPALRPSGVNVQQEILGEDEEYRHRDELK